MFKTVTILFLLVSFNSNLAAFSKLQVSTIQTIRDVARGIPDESGETYENTLSYISLVESSAGKNIIGDWDKNSGVSLKKASLGSLQIQLKTAKWVIKITKALKKYRGLSDQRLVAKLLTDTKFSATIAAHYLIWLKKNRKNYFQMVSGYNGGIENYPYYKRVMKAKIIIQKLIKSKRIK